MSDYDTHLAQFMAGIRRMESGGNYREPPNRVGASGAYQFIDSTWGGYGGYQHAYQAPPEIQDERARQLMGAYYRKFGSWNAVAQAWLGGPGSVGKNVSDGNIGSFDYANRVLSYAGLSGASPAPAGEATVPSGGSGGRVGLGMSVGGDMPSAGPDYHNVDVQAQTILGMLSAPASNVQAQALQAQADTGTSTPADATAPPTTVGMGDEPYLQRQGRVM